MPPLAKHARRWAFRLLFGLLILIGLILISPSRSLISVLHDGAGWSLSTRSLTDIIDQGLSHVGAHVEMQRFNTGRYGTQAVYCPTEISHGYAFLAVHHHYSWERPGDTRGSRTQRAERCEALRKTLLDMPGTLAAALQTGDPEQVKRHLDDIIVREGGLPLKLSEVGEPMRQTLAALMLAPADSSQAPVTPISVALAVGDITQVKRWAPEEGFKRLQRYALFQLGQVELVARHPEDHYSSWGRGGIDDGPGGRADGFERSDYFIANAHCDSEYAAFLKGKGITPGPRVVMQAFLSRLHHESPALFRHTDLSYHQSTLPVGSADATVEACTTLMAQYRDIELKDYTIRKLGELTGSQTFARFQDLVDQERNGRHFDTREAEDRFYEQLQFNQSTSPLPSLPGMFVALFKGRPSGATACAALDLMPWLLSHDRGLAEFMALAKSWNGKPLANPDYLVDDYWCTPSLLHPPSLYEQETQERNAFLKAAGLSCHMVTPETRYIYSQTVECTTDEH